MGNEATEAPELVNDPWFGAGFLVSGGCGRRLWETSEWVGMDRYKNWTTFPAVFNIYDGVTHKLVRYKQGSASATLLGWHLLCQGCLSSRSCWRYGYNRGRWFRWELVTRDKLSCIDPFQRHGDIIQTTHTKVVSDILERCVVGRLSLSLARRLSTQIRERCYMSGQHPSRVNKSSGRLSKQCRGLEVKRMI